jgi:hypothetical protein
MIQWEARIKIKGYSLSSTDGAYGIGNICACGVMCGKEYDDQRGMYSICSSSSLVFSKMALFMLRKLSSSSSGSCNSHSYYRSTSKSSSLGPFYSSLAY